MKIVEEFKAFALKGSVVDLAVGVIIGAAFGKIVSSMTNDIIMPMVGWLIGGVDFTDLKLALPEKLVGDKMETVFVRYGNFLQTTLDFLIIASAIFVAIKFINSLRKKQKEAMPPASPIPTKEETLLTEIRDLLKK